MHQGKALSASATAAVCVDLWAVKADLSIIQQQQQRWVKTFFQSKKASAQNARLRISIHM